MMSNGPALAILNGDSNSSKPSSGERSLTPASSTQPSSQVSELSAVPPTRNGLTPSPPGVSEIDFEKETKVKYRRSSIVPDYRHSMFPTESVPDGVPNGISNSISNGNPSPPRSSFINGNGLSNGKPSPPRSSFINGYTNSNTSASPRVSDLSVRPRRSISPESTRRQTTVGFPTTGRTNGAVSPLTVRSVSPVGWRSGAVSPIAARSSSPVGAYRASPLSNGGTQTPAQAQALAAHKLAARHTMAGLTLNTQMTVPAVPAARPRPQTSASNESDEAMDEVISLSPAVRAPVMRFKRSSTFGSAIGTPHPEVSSMTLDTVMEDGSGSGNGNGPDGKKYFGQDVNAEDLVAVNLENAFDML